MAIGTTVLWVFSTGCNPDLMYPTVGYVEKRAALHDKALDKHDEHMAKDHGAMSPEVAAQLAANRAQFTSDLGKIRAEAVAARQQQDQAIKQAVRDLGDFGVNVAKLPGSLTDLLMPDINDAKRDARSASEEVRVANANLSNFVTTVKDNKAELSEARRALAKLSEDTIAKLEEAREDRDQFEQILRAELKFTPDEIEDLKGMTTEQILALLAAAGGAAGIGIAGGRGGKSRAQPEIETLRGDLAKLTENVARRAPVKPT